MNRFFPKIEKIPFEGPNSKNPLAYRYYQPERRVGKQTMQEALPFAVCYWHTMHGSGADTFGGGAYQRAWKAPSDPMQAASDTLQAQFELIQKLGVRYYCFHDVDIAPEGNSLKEFGENLKAMTDQALALQEKTGIGLLWATANLFSHPRYTHGAATNPDPEVFAFAATQIRRAMDATHALGGKGYVFWGGREGYSNLLNTSMKQERKQLAAMLSMAVDYAQKIGFKGTFFIEPKPLEPTTHQYDYDAQSTLAFLQEFGLSEHFKLNLEANHATLAGHDFIHEIAVATEAGMLGSLDINRGNPLLGWDTDQFPTDAYTATLTMYYLLKNGGVSPGGLNFDAKLRRGSNRLEDLFHAHIGGIDTFARALIVADRMISDGRVEQMLRERYRGYEGDLGKKIVSGNCSFDELEKHVSTQGEPTAASGREEELENLINDYLFSPGIE